jgi:hypothetical protein
MGIVLVARAAARVAATFAARMAIDQLGDHAIIVCIEHRLAIVDPDVLSPRRSPIPPILL